MTEEIIGVKKEDPEELKKVNTYQYWAIFFIILGGVIFLISILLFLSKTGPLNTSVEIESKIFADFGNFIIGSVGVFWSLAGVFLFYGTLRLQREELTRQRKEFERSIKVAEDSLAIAMNQSTTSKLQQFDNTFFNLLNQHNEIVNSLKAQDPAKRGYVTGRECFKYLYESIYDEAVRWGSVGNTPNRNLSIQETLEVYQEHWRKEEFWVGHYFRNLYNLVRYVDRSDMEFPKKKVYTNIIRAQLTIYELLLLFYNCLSPQGDQLFKPLVQEYGLLKTIAPERLINPQHQNKFEQSAFDK